MRISGLQRLYALLTPRRCCICQRKLDAGEQLVCGACTLALPRTDHLAHPDDNAMAQVYWGRVPSVGRAAAFVYHHGHAESARPLYQLKYFSRPRTGVALGRIFGADMRKSGFAEGIDVIVPVPLARRRQRERGYNQSAMLARGLSEATGIPVDGSLVERTLFEGSQTLRDRWQRHANVEGAFRLRNAAGVEGRHILLVDDVVTTGATSCACAFALEQGRPARISFASLAFVDDNR